MAVSSASGQVLSLNVLKSELNCGGVCQVLKATPCRLLHLLLENAERIVSRETIYKEIWGYDFNPGTKILEVQVHYLRNILATSNSDFEIKTHYGKGISLRASSGRCPSDLNRQRGYSQRTQ